MKLYQYLASDAVVYVLPTPPGCELQDLVFTANLGIVLEHIPQKDVAIMANFSLFLIGRYIVVFISFSLF